ncbi:MULTISPECIES: zinc-binding dehydrogenase [Streptomyces]|uniref:Putative NADPH:quinone reductase n=1 Tax=Streptomyces olivaceus TaxID=47716 RepID=A0A2U8T8Q0_STROV|nr:MULTISPECIES: zinc-binding dehydrogenase [Streptomyces]AWM72924.1 putative NADPH:quinone reductase [Streptomyces olivaceus]MBZ6226772.1 zinc-binding dehydrogenase [Streptomyces olivaceus]MBZ6253057.1 zinc-binding dehydrogenase [Streptomyces olivaceus]MBZ6253922.1 zinc-binding dehydrogenase [Streptomyces olivaceus]UOG79483.1 zinc-binding dehydrogenase [Streptomyces sp. CB09030]
MKALVTTALDPLALELRSVPDPRPRPDEALVEVHATALNRADLLLAVRRPVGSPLGLDVVGTVLRPAPDGSGPPAGARVTGLASNNAWAELAAVRADRLAAIPDGVTDAHAATLPVAGLTALYALQKAGWLLGRHTLVTGASGGVGRLAVQLARAGGSEVTAWVGSEARGAGLADRGAKVVAGYDAPPTGPVDLLVDSVGGEVFAHGYRLLRPGGVAAVFGNTVRAELRLPADWGHARPGVRIEYLFLLDEVTRRDVPADLALLLGLVASGTLVAEPGLLTTWADPRRAIAALYSREVNGKVVLSV